MRNSNDSFGRKVLCVPSWFHCFSCETFHAVNAMFVGKFCAILLWVHQTVWLVGNFSCNSIGHVYITHARIPHPGSHDWLCISFSCSVFTGSVRNASSLPFAVGESHDLYEYWVTSITVSVSCRLGWMFELPSNICATPAGPHSLHGHACVLYIFRLACLPFGVHLASS